MTDAGAVGPRTTRRAVLGGVAGAAALGTTPLAAADSHDLRVMTRNLYIGVDLFRLAGAEDLEDLKAIAGTLLAEAKAHPYQARVEALADEVAATEPDVIGVQEGVLVRTREPSAFDGEHDPGAQDVLIDLLSSYRDALAERGLEYRVATSVVTNDVEVPAATDDGDVDVRVTDRTALLVRDGVTVDDTEADRFESSIPVPLAETKLTIDRGFCRAELSVAGERATVATTHLEAFDPNVRQQQATELRDRLPTDRPVVLAGDVNSGPGGESGAYGVLAESFADAVGTVSSETDVHTCCYDSDLRGGADALSSRVDLVLYRGALRPTSVSIVGADPDGRVTTEADGESVRLWPSDHAGVVATFELGVEAAATADAAAANSTPTASPTANGSDMADRQPEAQTGFGALVGAAAAAVALGRWLRRDA